MGLERAVHVVDPVVEDREDLEQLRSHLRVRPQQIDRLLEGRVLGERLVRDLCDEHVEETPLSYRAAHRPTEPWSAAR